MEMKDAKYVAKIARLPLLCRCGNRLSIAVTHYQSCILFADKGLSKVSHSLVFFKVGGGKYLNAKMPSYCCSCYCEVWRENCDYLGLRGFENYFQRMITGEE